MESLNQCCGYGMIYSGSGSSFEFSEFLIQIQAKGPDAFGCGSGSATRIKTTLAKDKRYKMCYPDGDAQFV